MAMNDAMYLGMQSYRSMHGQYSPTGLSGQGDYDTPGYYAGYQPTYADSSMDAYNPWTQGKSWGSSLWNMAGAIPGPLGAFSDSPAYQNANMSTQYNAYNLTSKPLDAVMTGAQQWVLPFAAYYAGHKLSNLPGGFANGGLQGFMNIFSKNQAIKLGLGTRMGQSLGRAAASPFGYVGGGLLKGVTGFGGASWGAGMAGRAGSILGAGIGYMAAPMAIGMGISSAVNAAVFDPYIDTRRLSAAMQTVNSSRVISGPNAAPNYGLGLSSYGATKTAAAVSSSAWSDMTFSNSQYTAMADYGMQAGVYDDIGGLGASQVVERTKKMASDVKRIMSVFGEKDMREAVGILAGFIKQGAGVGSAESNAGLSSLRLGTMMSGRGARDLYQSIGQPGGGIYAGYGMSQMAGLTNSMGVFAGMQNAHNMGLMSSRMLALMGGMEGVTLSATQARAGSINTDYNKMALYAQFFGGGTSNSMMGNISRFGLATSRDPMAAMGTMLLRGPEMMDAQAKANPLSAYSQYVQQLQQMYPGQKKFNMEQLAMVMSASGMGDEQVRAAALDIMNAKRGLRSDVATASYLDTQRQSIEQAGFAYTGEAGRAARRGLYTAGQAVSPIGESVALASSKASDWFANKWQKFRFGKVRTNRYADYFTSGGSYSRLTMATGGPFSDLQGTINKALKGVAGSDARALAEQVVSGGASAESISRLSKMMGVDVSPETASDYADKLRSTPGAVSQVNLGGPDFNAIASSADFRKKLALGQDGGWISDMLGGIPQLGGVFKTMDFFGKDGYSESRKERQLAGLAKQSPAAYDAYQMYVGSVLSKQSPDAIKQYINSLDPKTRALVVGSITNKHGGDADYAILNEFSRTGKVSATGLKRLIDQQVGSGAFDLAMRDPTSYALLRAQVGVDENGKLMKRTGKELKESYKKYSNIALTGALSGQEGIDAANSNVQDADIRQKNTIFDMINNYEASIDGSGDMGPRVMLRAAGLFKSAVDQFTEGVVQSSKDTNKEAAEQLKVMRDRTNQDIAAGFATGEQ